MKPGLFCSWFLQVYLQGCPYRIEPHTSGTGAIRFDDWEEPEEAERWYKDQGGAMDEWSTRPKQWLDWDDMMQQFKRSRPGLIGREIWSVISKWWARESRPN